MLNRALRELAKLLAGGKTVVLSGAGCSTESGIPDYRGPESRSRSRAPVLHQEFIRDPAARARYWAGSAVGWPQVARARPNPGHAALSRLERAALVCGIITQNVDGLHQAAGSRRVIELHGNLESVRCLECGAAESRAEVQRRLLELNPDWGRRSASPLPDGEAELAPDGDAAIAADLARARVADCLRCGGLLKPDVVFFGENVPRRSLDAAWGLLGEADALLVAGSSLTVYSGYRFVLGASQDDVPVGIVNVGRTRGDELARVKVEGRTGEVLPRLADALLRAAGSEDAAASPRSSAARSVS